jgi:hypothetical protein
MSGSGLAISAARNQQIDGAGEHLVGAVAATTLNGNSSIIVASADRAGVASANATGEVNMDTPPNSWQNFCAAEKGE